MVQLESEFKAHSLQIDMREEKKIERERAIKELKQQAAVEAEKDQKAMVDLLNEKAVMTTELEKVRPPHAPPREWRLRSVALVRDAPPRAASPLSTEFVRVRAAATAKSPLPLDPPNTTSPNPIPGHFAAAFRPDRPPCPQPPTRCSTAGARVPL